MTMTTTTTPMAGVGAMTPAGMAGVITAMLVATANTNAAAPLHVASRVKAADREDGKGLPVPWNMLQCNQLSSRYLPSFLK